MAFARFVAIDWSGARGDRHKGIAVAGCGAGTQAPRLIPPPDGAASWSRRMVLDWLLAAAAECDTLFGFDFSFAPPHVARGAYLPGDDVPAHARAFWAHVDRSCADPDLGAGSFLETLYRRHFYFGKADGPKAGFMHWRCCEARYNAGGGGKASTVFDAIGAAQVAKASFAGMRLLHHAGRHLPVWPIDERPAGGSLIVEIYTSIAARHAGRPKGRSKIRDAAALDAALAALGCEPHAPLPHYTDHATDVIMTAAWMRGVGEDAAYWAPAGLTQEIAQTEGWTFGVV